MSARKKSVNPEPQRTRKSPTLSACRAPQHNRTEPNARQLPELEEIRYAFRDAHSIVRCAYRVLRDAEGERDERDREDRHAATSTLCQGIDALATALDRLERAEMQQHRSRENES